MLDNLKVIKTMRGIKRAFDGLPGAPDCRTWDGYKVILRQQPESLIEPGWSRFYEFRPDGRPMAISMNHECTCDILSVTLGIGQFPNALRLLRTYPVDQSSDHFRESQRSSSSFQVVAALSANSPERNLEHCSSQERGCMIWSELFDKDPARRD